MRAEKKIVIKSIFSEDGEYEATTIMFKKEETA